MKKKRKVNPSNEDEVLDRLADALFLHVANAKDHIQDPFEEYTFRIKSKIFSDPTTFKMRCRRGYRALLQVIDSKTKN